MNAANLLENQRALQGHRLALVRAAEAVARDTAREGIPRDLTKTQLSNLVAVCQEATSGAEIENYLRYQVGRRTWPEKVAHRVLKKAEESVCKLPEGPLRVGAWRLYASYLKRAFQFQMFANNALQWPGCGDGGES